MGLDIKRTSPHLSAGAPQQELDAWADDWSYRYFRSLLAALIDKFDVCRMSDAPKFLESEPPDRPRAIVRHDIDVSVRRALPMAEIEAELGVRATYMVIPTSALYSLEDPWVRYALRRLVTLGHDVGLHIDLTPEQRAAGGEMIQMAMPSIAAAREELGAILAEPVETISYHRPPSEVVKSPLLTPDGMTNAYATELMGWYLSDSRARWREGNPLRALEQPGRGPLLQILIHPIWWGEEHASPEDRLQQLFEEETRMASHLGVSFDQRLMAAGLGIDRTGLTPEQMALL